jgi:hypothetical protein
LESAVFTSGARSSEEKPRYDLVPACALEREAIRMAEGARSHGENNYQRGLNDAAFIRDRINHMIEHALKYAAGDRSTDHLAAVRANAGMLCWFEAQRSGERRVDIHGNMIEGDY